MASEKIKRVVVQAVTKVVGNFTPRKWQERARDICRSLAADGSDRALIYACPGSGKTHGALFISKDLIDRIHKEAKIVVLTPNLAIKSQWIDRAASVGLELLEVKSGECLRQGGLGLSQSGFILGYQQVINMKHSLREFCESQNVIVILDEIHHTEGPRSDVDGNRWGHSVEYACAPAKFKLCTTGTPFREGNNPIALVRYNDGGEVIAQFTYTYEQAIRDKVCRPIEFAMFDGDIAWRDRGNGNIVSANFAKKLTKKLARQRLRAAVSTEGEFPRTILSAAHEKLLEIRSGNGVDRRAAGIVVACDTTHAQEIADELEAVTGQRPLLVHSKIDDAQDLINMFRTGDHMWVVGVNMLSEGVDIPRLRVGVYLSNIRASLYFHQFCGRMMRVMESERERAFVYMPADEELEDIALTIEKERCHALGEEYRPRLTRVGVRGGGGKQPLNVESSSAEPAMVAVSGNKYTVGFIGGHKEKIAEWRLKRPMYQHYSDVEVIQMMIDFGVISAPVDQVQ